MDAKRAIGKEPILSSWTETVDESGSHHKVYITPSGYSCRPSEKPYDFTMKDVHLSNHAGQFAPPTPYVRAEVKIAVHCKEGKTIEGVLESIFPMIQEDGKWLLKSYAQLDGVSRFEVVE
jgi:hypothetical protein